MVATFHLFRLPENAIVHVLQNIDINQLLIYSLVSSKTKRLVTSLAIEARDFEVRISDFLRISVLVHTTKCQLSLNFYNDSNDLPVDITLPVAASFEYRGTRIQSSTPLLSFSNWLNHIRTVFCCTRPPNIRFYRGCEKNEIGLLKETIGTVNVLFVCSLLTDVMSREVLKQFNTPNELFLERNPFEEACQTQQILIQNFEFIEFNDPFSLDDMLLINSERAESYHQISQTQFNRFVKHWIRGSNPRLQYMSLLIDMADFVNGEVYLKGIRCMEMSEDAKTEIREKYDLSTYVDMIQIRRKDGTTAAIGTLEDDVLYVHFIVLH
ncbi:hypothetical protein CRE_23075 [Caenorhabditis remanei]|uniref:F-box domain-containing protein n=1 Tax=Caenorhabditis remanei TaxID=31234 RepID=E3N9C8_CAERE|nr:hypothetical protein CRE_23075 [Caenorhabditis remanei]